MSIQSFIYGNKSGNMTITATSSLTDFPATNVASLDLNRVWRATKDSNVYLTFSGSTSYSFDSVFLYNTNLSATPGSGESVSIQLSSDNFLTFAEYQLNRRTVSQLKWISGKVETITSTVLFYIGSTPITFLQYRIKINMNTSHPYTFYHVGEVYLFSADYAPTIGGYTGNFEFGNVINDVSVENQNGLPFVVSKNMYRIGTLTFSCTQSELTALERIAFNSHVIFFPSGEGSNLSNPNEFILGKFSIDGPAQNALVIGGSYKDKNIKMKFQEVA